MSNELNFKTADFLTLMLAGFEYNSSSDDKARDYLISEGENPDSILQEGLQKIEELKRKIAMNSAIQQSSNAVNEEVSVGERPSRKWSHKSVLRFIKETGNIDPIDEIRKRVRNMVVKAFEYGWEGPPYSPVQLAKFFNIDVLPNDSLIDARIVPQGNDCFQIEYNPFQRPTRTNFSISHEIAHTLFSDCADSVRYREERPLENRELEQLCNIGASEIQLPYAVFSNDAENTTPSIDGLLTLANRYKASLESVFLRYAEVIDKPCIILIGIFNTETTITIDYHKSSRFSKVQIPFGFVIPADSKAYDCNSPGFTSREIVNWDFLGEPYEMSCAGISAYKRDNKPRVGILLFPRKHVDTAIEKRKIVLENGDATKPRGKGKQIIAQVVNDKGSLAQGFGKSVVKNFPKVKEETAKWKSDKTAFVLGNTNCIEVARNLYVFQILAQKGLYQVGNEIPLRYHHLRTGLISLRETAKDLNASVHMPPIGAGNAKGDWNIIMGMVHDELVNHDVPVSVYFLPGQAFDSKNKSNLTVFKLDSTWETGKLF